MITVVVCTHNGAGKIRGTLEALSAQDRAADRVIIVDDGSTDNVGEVVGPYTTEHGFRYIRLEQNVGLSAARNIGIEHAESGIVAFCDDDCVPKRSWIAELELA